MVKLDVEKIKKSPFLMKQLDVMKETCDKWLETPIPNIRFSDMRKFHDTGSRSEFEIPYFNRRGRLAGYAMLAYITGEEKYFTALEDIIWAICEETSWAVTAHYNMFDEDYLPVANFKYFIDLFAAETGFALSEIYTLLGDKLTEQIKTRIKNEVRERILYSFMNSVCHFRWEKDMKNNWAAVCGGSVAGAFFTFGTKDEINSQIPRFMRTMDVFLSSFEDDGACMEGIGYWSYGFGYFTAFADMIYDYTNGEVDYFKDEKIKTIARFQQKVYLNGNKVVTFSDAPGYTSSYSMGIACYLANRVEGMELPEEKYASFFGNDHCYRFMHIIRLFAWYDEKIEKGLKEKACYIMPDAMWYINRANPLSIAAKGGHNNEPHNHNDVGSFLILKNGEDVLKDLGAAKYTRFYFNPQTRYDILCNTSRGHSVPIVNGKYQSVGEEFRATLVEANEGTFAVDIAGAYEDESLKSLIRRFDVTDNKITISDTYSFDKQPESVVSRFITTTEPEVCANTVKIGEATLTFDTDAKVTVTKDVHEKHAREMEYLDVYIIDFEINNPQSEFTTTLTVE